MDDDIHPMNICRKSFAPSFVLLLLTEYLIIQFLQSSYRCNIKDIVAQHTDRWMYTFSYSTDSMSPWKLDLAYIYETQISVVLPP